jgi:hypothetical protein
MADIFTGGSEKFIAERFYWTVALSRLEFNTKSHLEFLKDFFFTLTFCDSYDNQPPAARGVTNDYGFTTASAGPSGGNRSLRHANAKLTSHRTTWISAKLFCHRSIQSTPNCSA